MSRVLVIPDIHAPFVRPGFLEFVKDVRKTYKCDKTVFIGDLIDSHAISAHNKSPKAKGAVEEKEAAKKVLKEFGKTFPKAYVCYGNHDERPFRQAALVGLAADDLKTLKERYGCPSTWKFSESWEIDDVLYIHGGKGGGSLAPHLNIAKAIRSSVVMGHFHSVGGVEFSVTKKDRIFGMCVGCGIQSDSYAFDYAKNMVKRPIIGCGVVIDGKLPIFIPMELGTRIKRVKR